METQPNVVEKELVLWKSGLETSISELKSDFNKIYDECQIDLASFNVVEKKVSSLQQHSQDVSLLLDGLREDVNEQAKQVMQNSSSFHRLADEQMKQKEQLLQHTQQQQQQQQQQQLHLHQQQQKQQLLKSISPQQQQQQQQTQLDCQIQQLNHQKNQPQQQNQQQHDPVTPPSRSSSTETDISQPTEKPFPETSFQREDANDIQVEDDSTELVFMIDSNARYIDFRRLWTLKTTEIVRCGNMVDVYKFWNNNQKKYNKLKYFFMSIGCNDLVTNTPHQLFTNIHTLVDRLRASFPGIKIIISEVTPRMDAVDGRVQEANKLINQYVEGSQDLFVTKNNNLRNPDFFLEDGIHLNHTIIPRFASNIKRALRAAYGIQFKKSDFHSYHQKQFIPNDTRNSNPSSSTQHQQMQQQQNQHNVLLQMLLRMAQQYQYPVT